MTDDLTLNEGVLIAAGQAAHQVLLNYDTPVTWVQAHVVAEAVLAVVAEQLRQQGRDEERARAQAWQMEPPYDVRASGGGFVDPTDPKWCVTW